MMDCYNDIYLDIDEEDQVMDFAGLEPYEKLVFSFEGEYLYLLKDKDINNYHQIELEVPKPDEDDDDYYIDMSDTLFKIFKNRGLVGKTINFCILKNEPYLAFHLFPPKDYDLEEKLLKQYANEHS